MTLSQRGRYARAGVLNVAAEKVPARDWIGKLPIKAHSE
jgi:ribose transport system ATP-binding protein